MASTTTMVRFLSDNMAVGGTSGGPSAYATGGALETLLPVFSGEILAAYNRTKILQPLVKSYTIPQGSAHMDFPLTWKIGSERHDAGDELLGLDSETGRRRIFLDDRPLVSHFAIDDIDELFGHFSLRNELATQVGIELSETTDGDVFKMLCLASRTAKVSGTSFPGGGGADATINPGGNFGDTGVATGSPLIYGSSNFNDIGAGTAPDTAHATAVLTAIRDCVTKWDMQNVPYQGRNCIIDPETWHLLRDLSTDPAMGLSAGTFTDGGVGFMQNGGGNPDTFAGPDFSQALTYRGVSIWRSNVVSASGALTDDSSSRYRAADYSKTVGVIFQMDAVGFISKMGIQMETARDTRRGQDFVVAKTLYGGGGLRVQNAVELGIPA